MTIVAANGLTSETDPAIFRHTSAPKFFSSEDYSAQYGPDFQFLF